MSTIKIFEDVCMCACACACLNRCTCLSLWCKHIRVCEYNYVCLQSRVFHESGKCDAYTLDFFSSLSLFLTHIYAPSLLWLQVLQMQKIWNLGEDDEEEEDEDKGEKEEVSVEEVVGEGSSGGEGEKVAGEGREEEEEEEREEEEMEDIRGGANHKPSCLAEDCLAEKIKMKEEIAECRREIKVKNHGNCLPFLLPSKLPPSPLLWSIITFPYYQACVQETVELEEAKKSLEKMVSDQNHTIEVFKASQSARKVCTCTDDHQHNSL